MKIGYDIYSFDEFYIYLFLKYCQDNHICFHNMRFKDHKCYVYISMFHRYKLSKTDYLNYDYSIGVLSYFHKNYILKLICILGFLFSVFLSSSFIFDIRVIGINKVYNHKILDIMDVAMLDRLLDYRELNDLFLLLKKEMLPCLDYLNVYQKGSVLFVEYTSKKNIDERKHNYKPLYACKDGLICDIHVDKGNVLVQLNDYVKKGDKLVDNQILSSSHKVNVVEVKGEVYAYTFMTLKGSVMNKDKNLSENFLRLLLKIRSRIPADAIIDKENVLQISSTNSKIDIVVQYTLKENIAVKGDRNEGSH